MKESEEITKAAMIANMKDGVYIIRGEQLYDFLTAQNLKDAGEWDETDAHIVVVCPNMVFMIDGKELGEFNFELRDDFVLEDSPHFFDIYCATHMTDDDAFEETELLAKAGCPAALAVKKQGEKCFLPSVGHLCAIHHFRHKINRAIDAFCLDDTIVDWWYWSCCQEDASYAWYIYIYYGSINSNYKTSTNRVRAISAIDLNSLTLHLFNCKAAE